MACPDFETQWRNAAASLRRRAATLGKAAGGEAKSLEDLAKAYDRFAEFMPRLDRLEQKHARPRAERI